MVYFADQDHPRKRLKLWDRCEKTLVPGFFEDFHSDPDCDYKIFWRDWVG